MCGRFSLTVVVTALKDRFGCPEPDFLFGPRYNIAPGQDSPVIVNLDGRRLELFRWGLIPAWAKDPKIGSRTINARAETVKDKPSYRRPFQTKRCLVIADGFYEWSPGRAPRSPYRFTLKSGEPFGMAGLWNEWTGPDNRTLRTFTILTTVANDIVRPIFASRRRLAMAKTLS